MSRKTVLVLICAVMLLPFGASSQVSAEEPVPAAWSNLTPSQQAILARTREYISDRARKIEGTDSGRARELDRWAVKMANQKYIVKDDPSGWLGAIYTWWSGGAPKMSRSRITGNISIYENALTAMEASFGNPDPNIERIFVADAASSFIHELRHVDGHDEFGAYSYEWEMFEALGISQYTDVGTFREVESLRYTEVKSQLRDVVEAQYDPDTDSWRRWGSDPNVHPFVPHPPRVCVRENPRGGCLHWLYN